MSRQGLELKGRFVRTRLPAAAADGAASASGARGTTSGGPPAGARDRPEEGEEAEEGEGEELALFLGTAWLSNMSELAVSPLLG